jgi:DNA-binding response OmpR family regulator
MSHARILVVDDDADFAETMADVLTLSGHEVTIAGTGEDAVRLARQQHFDICFMDVKLPGMNGLESFLEIHRRSAKTRFIMMTGFSVERMLEEATASGASAVLRKPFDMGEVAALVKRLGTGGIVLIADDDPDFGEMLREELAGRGYAVSTVRDGAAALEAVRGGGIDLLILDLRLPVLSGLEVFVELRRSGKGVPTIVVTGYAHEENASLEALRKLAVAGVLTKPFETKALLSVVDSVLVAPKG